MKTQIKKISLFALVLSAVFSCTTSNPVARPNSTPLQIAACSTTNTAFQQLYANVVSLSGHSNTVTFDTEIHEYQFKMASSISICSIGYQSQPAIASVPYKIEILNAANTVIYSGNLVFGSGTTTYVPITPVAISAGQVYTMRRTMPVASAGNLFSNIIGRVVAQPGALISFPQTFGPMTVIGANFYQNGGPLVNQGIPFIDFGY